MEISAEFDAAITDRALNILEIVDGKFLWNYIDDLVSCRDISLILIGDQLINFHLRDFVLGILPHEVAPCLQALNMVTCYANINFFYIEVWIGGKTIFESGPDGFDRFINVEHLPVLHTIGIGFSKTQDLQLAEFVLPTGDHGDLSRSDIEPDNNGLFVVHNLCV